MLYSENGLERTHPQIIEIILYDVDSILVPLAMSRPINSGMDPSTSLRSSEVPEFPAILRATACCSAAAAAAAVAVAAARHHTDGQHRLLATV